MAKKKSIRTVLLVGRDGRLTREAVAAGDLGADQAGLAVAVPSAELALLQTVYELASTVRPLCLIGKRQMRD